MRLLVQLADFHGSPESIGFVPFRHGFSQGIEHARASAKNMAIDDDLLANCPRRNCVRSRESW